MASNNDQKDDTQLLDLAMCVRMACNLAKEEVPITGREEYNAGRYDAFRIVYFHIREELGLDGKEFDRKVDGRLAFRLIERSLSPGLRLNEKAEWEMPDGKYTLTCEKGRIRRVDNVYEQQLDKE